MNERIIGKISIMLKSMDIVLSEVIMMIKVFTLNKDKKIELTKEEL